MEELRKLIGRELNKAKVLMESSEKKSLEYEYNRGKYNAFLIALKEIEQEIKFKGQTNKKQETMTKYGRIPDNVGFRQVDGVIRRLTIREQLLQVKHFKGINEINHPMLGKIEVDRNKVDELLNYEDGHLIRFKKSMFK